MTLRITNSPSTRGEKATHGQPERGRRPLPPASEADHRTTTKQQPTVAGPWRITLFVMRFPLLSETFVISHVAGLLDRGHDVRVIARWRPRWPANHADVTRYRMMERTTYLDTRQRTRVQAVARGLTMGLRHGWRKRGTLVRALNVLRHGRQAASLRLLGDGMACEAAPCDIIHCHFGQSAAWAVHLRQIGALQGRLVVTFHGYDMSDYLRQHGDDVYQHLFAHGDLFLPISERWRNRLIELGCPPERTHVHRMGIDCSRFTYREPSPPQGPVKLLTVSRLVEKKGAAYAIRAVASLLKRGYSLDYTIVGDGPHRRQLAWLIDELGVGAHVHLMGGQTQEQIVEHLQSADLFMAPSVTAESGDQEGVPVAIMEAMAVGLPVLSTWHSGIPELVDDGTTGLLTPERDADALAERLRQLVDHPERWAAMGRAGRAKVESAFDLEKLNDQLVERYRALLEPT